MPTILALDIATSLGFAVGAPGETPTMGTVDLRTKEDHDGAPFALLIDWLWPTLVEHKPYRLIYEAPMLMMPEGKTDEDGRRRGGNAKTLAKLIGLACTVDMICFRAGVQTVKVASQTARKSFIGTGRHPDPKPAVMAECKRRGWYPKGHDESDAACCWAYACALYFPAQHRVSYRNPVQ